MDRGSARRTEEVARRRRPAPSCAGLTFRSPRQPLLALAAVCLLLAATGCKCGLNKNCVPASVATSREFSQQGLADLERGEWEAGEQKFAAAIKACPDDADARRLYAETLAQRGELNLALEHLRKALTQTPQDATLHLRYAELAWIARQPQVALDEANTALQIDPRLAAAWVFRAKIHQESNRPQLALADCYRALRHQPQNEAALLQLATTYRSLDQPWRALGSLQEVCALYPPGAEPPDVLYQQGLAYAAVGRHNEAANALATACKRGPPNAEWCFQLAEAQMQLGQREQASATCRQALQVTPDHPPSLALLEQIQLAQQPRALRVSW